MKNTFKKILVTALSIVMIMSCTLVSFAEGESGDNEVALTSPLPKGTIQLNGIDTDDKCYAYPILTVQYDGTNDVKYVMSTAFKTFLSTYTDGKITATDVDEKLTQYQGLTNDSEDLKKVLGAYTKYCVDTPVEYVKPDPANDYSFKGPGTLTVDLGQYVIYGTSPSKTGKNVFSLMTASFPVYTKPGETGYFVKTKVTIDPKITTPTLKKTTTAKTVSYGDPVPFTIVTTVPQYPLDATHTTYEIGDELGTGLTFGSTTYTITVKASTDGINHDTTLKDSGTDKDYTPTKNTDGFKLVFEYQKIKGYKSIQVEYSAIITSDAVIGNPIENTATLKYSTSPYTGGGSEGTSTSTTKVYTYGIDVTKVKKGEPTTKLNDVEFELYTGYDAGTKTYSGLIKFIQDTGTKVYEVSTDTAASEKLKTSNIAPDDGKLIIGGLKLGTYYLKETKAADGYALNNEPTVITIEDDDKDGKVNGKTEAGIESSRVDVTIENAPITTNLPQTGGIGTYVFLAIGLIGMSAALILFARLKKKEQADR